MRPSGVLPQDGDGATSATAQPLEDLDDGGLPAPFGPKREMTVPTDTVRSRFSRTRLFP